MAKKKKKVEATPFSFMPLVGFSAAFSIFFLILYLKTRKIGLLPFVIFGGVLGAGGILCELFWPRDPGGKGSYLEYCRKKNPGTAGIFPEPPDWLQDPMSKSITRFFLYIGLILGTLVLVLVALLTAMGLTADVMTLVFPNRTMGTVTEARYDGKRYGDYSPGSLYAARYEDVQYTVVFDRETAGQTRYDYQGKNQFAAVKKEGSRQLVLFFGIDRVYVVDLWKLIAYHSAMAVLLLLAVPVAVKKNKLLYPLRYKVDRLQSWVRPCR